LGEFYVKQGKPELAEDKYLSAQKLYEADSANLSRTRFAADGNFGKIYYNLGALSFSIANYRRALDYFTTAEKNGFEDTDQTYKKGYVYYDRSDYDNALLEFHKANGQLPDSANILFALGTTEYRRFQYPVAEGYFLYLVEQLEKKKAVTGVTRIEDDVQYRALVTNLFIAYNNLGCTYYKRSAFGSDMNATKAVAYLQKATELYDSISRDPEAIERLKETTFTTSVGKKDSKSPAPFYNLDVIFHGKNMQTTLGEQGDLIIYDLAAASFANDSAGSGGTAASGQTELR
jgi:tetratricopeptide (TPR) repeat protein